MTTPSFPARIANQACAECASADRLSFQFSYAFQPIVDLASHEIFAHEALVRGPAGESARSVLDLIDESSRFRFDQTCRVKAIAMAAALNIQAKLSINFLPNAILQPEVCIRTTLEAARIHGFPIDRIIFEAVEGERVSDSRWLANVLGEYRKLGFLTAIDDFGAGFAGLNFLADFQPDIIKIDMGLVRNMDTHYPRRAIVRTVAKLCEELKIQVIGEGVETIEECRTLEGLGIRLQQGYLFSKPLFQSIRDQESLIWPTGL